jgi:hypothetical protein
MTGGSCCCGAPAQFPSRGLSRYWRTPAGAWAVHGLEEEGHQQQQLPYVPDITGCKWCPVWFIIDTYTQAAARTAVCLVPAVHMSTTAPLCINSRVPPMQPSPSLPACINPGLRCFQSSHQEEAKTSRGIQALLHLQTTKEPTPSYLLSAGWAQPQPRCWQQTTRHWSASWHSLPTAPGCSCWHAHLLHKPPGKAPDHLAGVAHGSKEQC